MAPPRLACPCPEHHTRKPARDPASRRSRIESLLPHARRIARREARRTHQDFDDVFSGACLGAIAAVDNFDDEHGRTLSRYAESRIRGEILDGLRRRDWASRALRSRLKSGQSRSERPLSLDALTAELAAVSTGSGAGTALADLIPDQRDEYAAVDDRHEAAHLRRWVDRVVASLPAREALVLRQHLRGRTLRQIGAELAVTEARVSQLRKRALYRLREGGLRDPRVMT
ncbi:MAG: FliA/WhiG family RNA polymerase sigma factor [Mycobacteriales bacterium]